MKKALLTAIAISALFVSLVAGVYVAEAEPKPSVPEFTVKFVDRSYDVPASTSIDPYSGKTVTNPAYHVENKTIEFSIKNQTVSSSSYLYYKIRMKGPFSENWVNACSIRADEQSMFTSLLFSSSGEGGFHLPHEGSTFYAPYGGQIDFQVMAQVWGYVAIEMTPTNPFGGWTEVILGESDWSNTQTITIPDTSSPSPASSPSPIITPSPSPTQQPTIEPTQTASPTLVVEYVPDPLPLALSIIAVVISIVTLGMLVYSKKYNKNK